MAPALTLHHVSKTFVEPGVRLAAVKDISFTVTQGEFFVMLGPSGCGKSTLLRAMAGLDQDFSGTIIRDGVTDPTHISFVFQQFALLPWLNIYENVEMGILDKHLPAHEAMAHVNQELKRFGLEKFRHSYPRDLSGGMQQRGGLARAFVRQPRILFLDEPFSELDSFTAARLRQELLQIWRETGVTIIMVTHIVEEAIELGDRIAVLSPRPSVIEKIVTNPLSRPRNRRSPAFFHIEDQLYELVKP
jgi:ABC-type nitrate/sulfonate/bicarbonate transport system ATPase subunit